MEELTCCFVYNTGTYDCNSLMLRWVVGSILDGVDPPIKLFLVPPTTGVTNAVVCAILSVGWCI